MIPFYNDAELINPAIRSLLAQTYPHWEGIVLDDSIQPDQASAVQGMIAQFNDPRLKYSKNPENLGMSKNINQGFDLAQKGGYDAVTILHSDDALDPDYAQEMAKAFERHPAAYAFFCETKIIDRTGKGSFSFPDWYKKTLLPPKKDGEIILQSLRGIETLIPGNFVFCPTLCFSVKKLGNHRYSESLKMVPDFQLTLSILLEGGSVIGLYRKPLYYYRRHESNSTNLYNKNLLRFREERDLYLELGRQLKARGEERLARLALQLRVVKLNLLFNAAKSVLQLNFRGTASFIRFLIKET